MEVLLGVPVGLHSCDISLDLLLVEKVVLGNRLTELGWVSEDLSPSIDGSNVLVHVLAGVESLWDLQNGQTKLKSGLGVFVPATFLDIGNASLNLLCHEITALEAGLNLSQVVITGHAVDETSNEVGCVFDSKVGNSRVGLDGSNSERHQSCKIITSLEELLRVPVRLHGCEVRLDLLLMEGVVLGECRRQLGWVGEDLGPGFDSCDVAIHVLASV